MASAREIYQDYLDHVSRAVWQCHFNVVAEAMFYPHLMLTLDETRLIEGPEQLITELTGFRRCLSELGAREYHRICRRADYSASDATEIEGAHETFVLRGAQPVVGPYLNDMTLVLREGRWLARSNRSMIRNADAMILSIPARRQVAGPDTHTTCDRSERSEKT